jgi:hypothetical protein
LDKLILNPLLMQGIFVCRTRLQRQKNTAMSQMPETVYQSSKAALLLKSLPNLVCNFFAVLSSSYL